MTTASPPFADAVARFVFEHGAVRGAVVSLDRTCAEIMQCHAYPEVLARALAELLGAAALLAFSLKFDGSLTVQLQGEGPVRLLVVECDASLALRATAQWTDEVHALPADAGLAALAGGAQRGRLAITLDPKDGRPIYQGIVALEATSIAGLIEHYLETSEQIPSRIVLARDRSRVRGLLLQRLPGSGEAEDALWQRAAAGASELRAAELLQASTPAALITRQFPHDDLRLFRLHGTRFGCSCSQARVENVLRMVGREEVEDILAEQGEVSVTCEFCNRAYGFSSDAARALFAGDSAHRGGSSAVRH